MLNKQANTLHFLMPAEIDLGEQVRLAHRNIGFDSSEYARDPDSGLFWLKLAKTLGCNEAGTCVQEAETLNMEIRDWFETLFGENYEEVTTYEDALHWGYELDFALDSDIRLIAPIDERITAEDDTESKRLSIHTATFEELCELTDEKLKTLIKSKRAEMGRRLEA